MKASNYNYLITRDNNSLICFNGVSSNFFDIPIKHKENLLKILQHPLKYKDILPSFYELLKDGSFIIEDSIDEINTIREKYNSAVNYNSKMLIIMPTLDCNFRCWYCIQDHNSGIMSQETVEEIKLYIQKSVEEDNLDYLHIEWFGGEPFLYFREIIEPIILYAKEICIDNSVNFISSATTNGYLIDDNIAKRLDDLNFRFFQITLDGDREHHNKTRVAEKDSSFDKILHNINLICQFSKFSVVKIRINYDDKNLNPDTIFEQINQAIHPQNKSKVEILLRKVWQAERTKTANNKLKILINKLKSAGFRYRAESDLVLNSVPCYASRKGMCLITPSGSIDKCSAREDFDFDKGLGKLENGKIKWKDDLPIEDLYSTPLFENEQCLKCKYLPICMGPCSRDLSPNKINDYKFYCKKKSNDLNFQDSILIYCDNVV
jgi:uncharacterized protein